MVPGSPAGRKTTLLPVDLVLGWFGALVRLLSTCGRTTVSASVSTSGRTSGADPKRELRDFFFVESAGGLLTGSAAGVALADRGAGALSVSAGALLAGEAGALLAAGAGGALKAVRMSVGWVGGPSGGLLAGVSLGGSVEAATGSLAAERAALAGDSA